MNKKWRSKGLWVALASALLLAAQSIGVLFGYEITDVLVQKIMVAVNSVLAVLVTIGVIRNNDTNE